MKTTIEMVSGSYGKIVRGGRTLARADKLVDGSWRVHVTGSSEWTTVSYDAAVAWLALQAIVL